MGAISFCEVARGHGQKPQVYCEENCDVNQVCRQGCDQESQDEHRPDYHLSARILVRDDYRNELTNHEKAQCVVQLRCIIAVGCNDSERRCQDRCVSGVEKTCTT